MTMPRISTRTRAKTPGLVRFPLGPGSSGRLGPGRPAASDGNAALVGRHFPRSLGLLAIFAGSLVEAQQAPRTADLVGRLRSPVPANRCAAAIDLGALGEKAAEAIPALIALFTDNASVVMKASSADSKTVFESETSPAEQAAYALGRIGRPAVERLLLVLGERKADPFEDRFLDTTPRSHWARPPPLRRTRRIHAWSTV